ncbi:MAG: MG2 domain-containing protein, partial [Gemmatimonadota bacterium]|nr:MG2 domain-containing protein [Gemmatimonadota bacterium]
VLAGLEAMDGSQLRRPHRFEFTTAAAQVVDGFPVGPYNTPEHLEVRPVFQLALDSPVPGSWVAERTTVQTEARCGAGVFAVELLGVRDVEPDDERRMYRLRNRGGADAGAGRRVVEVTPAEPLPGGCSAELQLPLAFRDNPGQTRWRFKTRGELRVDGATCGGRFCPTGPIRVSFSNPVRGAEVLRHVSVEPAVPFAVSDTTREATTWALMGEWGPRRSWTLTVAPGVTDAFGGVLAAAWSDTVSTTGYEPLVSYEHGRQLVERGGPQTLAVQHLNVDTLVVERILVPDSLESRVLEERWGLGDVWQELADQIDTVLVPVDDVEDRTQISGFPLEARGARRDGGTLQMVQVSANGARTASYWQAPIAMLQVTNLAVHSRVGVDEAVVWVTDVSEGGGLGGVSVTLHGPEGDTLATGFTGPDGVLVLGSLGEVCGDCSRGYLTAEVEDDRAVISLDDNENDLSPWAFGAYRAWGIRREPVAASVFTERGIYRPGEPVYAKAIVRVGTLGALSAPSEDSARLVFYDRDGGVLADSIMALSAFGTADRSWTIPDDGSLGTYRVEAQLHRNGKWTAYGSSYYRVAEYRPPEFLVDAVVDEGPRFAGDSIEAVVSGRYLFGAPMKGMPVDWQARREPVSSWALRLPGFDGWQVGPAYRWWEDADANALTTLRSASDTLDADGRLGLQVEAPAPEDGRAYRLSTFATVTDLNRQAGSASTSVLVHPASFYVGARQDGGAWFWTAGDPVDIEVMTATPGGESRTGVGVEGALIRWEWHSAERTRNGVLERVGGWVQDTVATCSVVTARDPATCRVTPPAGGSYQMTFRAEDDRGRFTRTSFNRWAGGAGWVPWNDQSRFKMDVIADKEEYHVGDTATVML